MATFIDPSFFFGDLTIAQSTETTVQNKIKWFIDFHEPEFLTALLGYDLYKYMIDNPGVQRVLDIKNGKEYTEYDNGPTRKFRGLLFTENVTTKKSAIAYYVYYKFIQNNQTKQTASGEKKTKSENSEEVSPKNKLFTTWNRMVDLNWELIYFLERNLDVYPEYQKYSGTEEQINLLSRANYVF